jgi:hypothetical protein
MRAHGTVAAIIMCYHCRRDAEEIRSCEDNVVLCHSGFYYGESCACRLRNIGYTCLRLLSVERSNKKDGWNTKERNKQAELQLRHVHTNQITCTVVCLRETSVAPFAFRLVFERARRVFHCH